MTYCKIIGKNSEIIAAGEVISEKNRGGKVKKVNVELISFDGKYFFYKNGNRNYIVKPCADPIFVPYEERSDFIMKPWSDIEESDECDVYREYGLDELDPEVVNLVKALNLLPSAETTGSCSGHGTKGSWVMMRFKGDEGLKSLRFLLNLLQSKSLGFYTDFEIDLCAIDTFLTADGDDCMLKLKTTTILPESEGKMNRFAKYVGKLMRMGTLRKSQDDMVYT